MFQKCNIWWESGSSLTEIILTNIFDISTQLYYKKVGCINYYERNESIGKCWKCDIYNSNYFFNYITFIMFLTNSFSIRAFFFINGKRSKLAPQNQNFFSNVQILLRKKMTWTKFWGKKNGVTNKLGVKKSWGTKNGEWKQLGVQKNWETQKNWGLKE